MNTARIDAKVEKREARRALKGLDGVGAIAIAWDRHGRELLRVDIEPAVDRQSVEQRLSVLRIPYTIRTVVGFVTAM